MKHKSLIALANGFIPVIARSPSVQQNMIPAKDTKQCGGSKGRMYYNVDDDVTVVDDVDDDDGNECCW